MSLVFWKPNREFQRCNLSYQRAKRLSKMRTERYLLDLARQSHCQIDKNDLVEGSG